MDRSTVTSALWRLQVLGFVGQASRSRLVPTFWLIATDRSATIVVNENGPLDLIGNVRDQFRRGVLQTRRLIQQFANASHAGIFQSEPQSRACSYRSAS